MVDKTLYTEDSIESLSPLAFTRLRPQVYAGDCTYSTQLLVEIMSNAIDEFRLGHGSRIDVCIINDIITVRDYGQGFIPNSFRDDGKTILEALNTDLVCDAINTAMRELFLQIAYGRSQTAFSDDGLPVGAGLDDDAAFLHVHNGTHDAADGGDSVTLLDALTHGLGLLLPLVLGTDQQEVENSQHDNDHQNGSHSAAGGLGGTGGGCISDFKHGA